MFFQNTHHFIKKVIVIVGLCFFVPTYSWASDAEQGPYLGIGSGSTKYQGYNKGVAPIELSNTAYKFYAGFHTKYSAFEWAFVNFGKLLDSPDIIEFDTNGVSSLSGNIIGILPLGNLELSIKVGAFFDGNTVSGLGFLYRINDKFAMRAEWETIEVQDKNFENVDFEMTTVSLQYYY